MNVAPSAGGSPGLDPQAAIALAKGTMDASVESLIGASPAETSNDVGARPSLPLPAGFTQDRVSPSLPELTHPAIQALLRVVEARVFPTQTVSPETVSTQTAEPIRTNAHLAAPGSLAQAYAAQTLTQNPDAPDFEARESALRSVGKAAHAIETAGGRNARVPDDVEPRIVLALANQFIATGQLANYLRAEELGRMVALWFDGPLPVSMGQAGRAGRASESAGVPLEPQSHGRLKKLWTRAPLLMLFSAWLSSGLVVALLLRILGIRAWENTLILDAWAIGFLALVVFQFVATIRGALRLRSELSRPRTR